MNKLVSDQSIDSIKISPTDSTEALRLLQIQGSPELLVLTSALNFFNQSEMGQIASAILNREGIGIDGTGFRYPTDVEPGEEPLEGVEIYNPLGEIQVSIPAFERLMARYLRTLITEAKIVGFIAKQTFWTEFVSMAEKIEQRVLENI